MKTIPQKLEVIITEFSPKIGKSCQTIFNKTRGPKEASEKEEY